MGQRQSCVAGFYVLSHGKCFVITLSGGVNIMKKREIFIRCLILVMFIAVCSACATKPILENTGEFIDDSVITTKIKSQIAGDSLLKAFQISVETFKSTVQLSGFVNSQQDVDRATEIANNVQGVRSVKNNLIVK
jgi:hypothetical protein